ncbi:MAG: recombinase family protein [Acidiferrobacteraceae bacterium]
MPKTAVYIRVSSVDQNTASQESEINQWLERQQIDPADIIRYIDQGESGTTMKRPQLDRLLKDVNSGHIARIVIWRLDRLARLCAGLTALLETLSNLNVALISIREGFDITTPTGRMIANVLASVAQFETEVRRERQMAGIAEARKRGVYRGRKPGSTKRPSVRALNLWNRGLSASEISKILGVCPRTVWNYIAWARAATSKAPPTDDANHQRPIPEERL